MSEREYRVIVRIERMISHGLSIVYRPSECGEDHREESELTDERYSSEWIFACEDFHHLLMDTFSGDLTDERSGLDHRLSSLFLDIKGAILGLRVREFLV